MKNKFYEFENTLISTEITEKHFTCDLNLCKGACCTMKSLYGAPLEKHEIEKIDEILPIVKTYLSEKSVKAIEKQGFWEEKDEMLMTSSINHKDCVFVYYDGDIAKCSIEKAYYDGKVDFIKPVSCHLFPIKKNTFGGDILRYEEYSECKPALENGKKTKFTVLEFCKSALIRTFGNEWYQSIVKLKRN